MVAADVLQFGVLARLLARRRVDLVAIAEHVDQPGRGRLGADERTLVDQRAHVGGGHPAPVGDPLGELLGDRLDEPLLSFAVRRVEAALGQDVHGVLVFVPLGEFVFDADLVQRAAAGTWSPWRSR